MHSTVVNDEARAYARRPTSVKETAKESDAKEGEAKVRPGPVDQRGEAVGSVPIGDVSPDRRGRVENQMRDQDRHRRGHQEAWCGTLLGDLQRF
jgi:hypothetical protein